MLLGWPAHSHCPKRGLTHNASDTYVARALLACCVRAACCARTSVHHCTFGRGGAVRPLHAVCGTGRDAYRMHAMCACARMRACMLPSRPAGDPRYPSGIVLCMRALRVAWYARPARRALYGRSARCTCADVACRRTLRCMHACWQRCALRGAERAVAVLPRSRAAAPLLRAAVLSRPSACSVPSWGRGRLTWSCQGG